MENMTKLRLLKGPHYDFLLNLETNEPLYVREHGFTPRANSIYFKPSFGGREILLGQVDGKPIYSNGVWFAYTGYPKLQVERITERLGND